MRPNICLFMVWFFALAAVPQAAVSEQPVFDVHMHFKWSQLDVTTEEQALAAMNEQGIQYAVIIGTPAELALRLDDLAPERIVPIFSPYRSGGDWFRWAYDPSVLQRAREALASGRYKGIGELHLISGFAPSERSMQVLDGLMNLAAEYQVPILLHTEFSQADYMLKMCSRYPDTQIAWAHAGAVLQPDQLEPVMAGCKNLWLELSAKDPWRFVHHPISDDEGSLLPEWRNLILKYPDRFMVGSDTVWPVEQLDSWDEPDTGWQELGRFWGFHRQWLSRLPADIAQAVSMDNARRLFSP